MTLEQLLALLGDGTPGLPKPAPSAPIPLAPVNNIGPLRDDTALAFAAQNPEPVPPRFVQPAAPDADFVDRYSGQAPTPPAPLSRAQRIFNAIGGFAAGGEGRGGEYLEQLRQPQRQYERQREQFEDRRTRGIELAERRAEREAEQSNRMAEAQDERDYRTWLQKTGVRDEQAQERLRQSFELEKQARAFRMEEARQLRLEQRQRQDDARGIAGRLGTGPGAAPPAIAKELGLYYANVTDSLSPNAARWQNAQARRMEVLARGGGGGTGRSVSNAAVRAAQELESAKGEFITFLQNRGRFNDKQQVTEERRIRARIGRAVGALRKYPGQLEGGVDSQGWPWVKVVGQQPQFAQPGQPQGAQPQQQ